MAEPGTNPLSPPKSAGGSQPPASSSPANVLSPIPSLPTNRPAIVVATNIVRLPPPPTAPAAPVPITAVPATSSPAASPPTISNPSPNLPPTVVRPPPPSTEIGPPNQWLLAQVALVAHGISPGPIDGIGGAQSAVALRAFQSDHGLESHGRLDRETVTALAFQGPALTEFIVGAEHLGRLHPVPESWVGKAAAEALDYESLMELVGEATQSHPGLLRRLNPGMNWDAPTVGTRLTVPLAQFPPPRRASLIRISLAGKWLRAFDDRGRLLAHFPCSIAARVEKRPVGELAVAVVVKDPNYTFDPAGFPESAEARKLTRKLVLNPGPNNPVGVAWIGLNRPGYGIHGTPRPEQVGRTESHGCFRLANWNAEYLRQMCWVGMPVDVER